MKAIFSLTVLGFLLRLTMRGASGFPNDCVVSPTGDDVECRGCGLNSVPQDFSVNVTKLDLANNQLVTLQPRSFLYLPNLQSLKLEENGMRNISLGPFDGLVNLRYLSLSGNKLESSIGKNTFKPLINLRVLDLHGNYFHTSKSYPIDALLYLTNIDALSIDIFEQFSFGKRFSRLKNLTTLNLHGIDVCSIRNTSFKDLGSLEILHLTIDSRIRFIEKDALSPFRNLTLLDIDSHRTISIREVLQALYGLRNRTMEQIRSTDNFRSFENPVKIMSSDIVYLKTICVKRLYLVRNSISNIPVFVIVSWTSRHLAARQCRLRNDFLSYNSRSVFYGLYSLTYVDLSENHFDTLHPMTFRDQRNALRVLLIAENAMKVFPREAVESLDHLEYIDVTGNDISRLTPSDCEIIDSLKQRSEQFLVNLNNNPLVCSCEDLDFLHWVMTSRVLYNKDNLKCMTTRGDRIQIKDLQQNFERFQIDCASFNWLIVSIVLVFVSCLLTVFSVVSWRYSAKLRVWFRQPTDGPFTHYAFISYSDKDAKWVRERLVPQLDLDGLSFLCEDKHFVIGKDLATNILDAIDNCYKSVFVVSYHFLNCEWTRYAMQVTSGYSFRHGREHMNIVILLDDIKLSELPKLLRKNWDNAPLKRDLSGHKRIQDLHKLEINKIRIQ
ncbi:toll-like receptor 2 [Ylistrum balloti]|uniref:toll-like receptor 2 n=1 Tax=Ylistrum balloti TaxID=509963 RepID=UPI0029058492|nr:toll-like receptor 2 [Ylistrum balloti]